MSGKESKRRDSSPRGLKSVLSMENTRLCTEYSLKDFVPPLSSFTVLSHEPTYPEIEHFCSPHNRVGRFRNITPRKMISTSINKIRIFSENNFGIVPTEVRLFMDNEFYHPQSGKVTVERDGEYYIGILCPVAKALPTDIMEGMKHFTVSVSLESDKKTFPCSHRSHPEKKSFDCMYIAGVWYLFACVRLSVTNERLRLGTERGNILFSATIEEPGQKLFSFTSGPIIWKTETQRSNNVSIDALLTLARSNIKQ